MSWDFDSGSTKKQDFTKFPEGVTKIRVIQDIPNMRWTHWLNAQRRSVNCPGKDCPICEIRRHQKANKEPYTHAMGRRISIQIINRNTNKIEIMEQGVTFFEELKIVRAMLAEKGKKLEDVDLLVRRRGTGKDNTTYRLDIDEEYPLTDADQKLVEEMIDLNEYFKPHEPDKIIRVLNGEEFDKVMYDQEDEVEEDIEIA